MFSNNPPDDAPNNEAKTIFFYVGARKTASTMVRRYLTENKDYLLKEFSTLCRNRREILDSPFYSVISTLESGTAPSKSEMTAGLSSFDKLISHPDADKVILHNENFFSATFFNESETVSKYLATASRAHTAKMVIYVRNQADYIESWYLQSVHTGNVRPFDQYYKRISKVDFSWLRVLRDIEHAFGKENIICLPFETISLGAKSFLEKFLYNTVGTHIDVSKFDTDSKNRSFSRIALDIAVSGFPQMTNEEIRTTRLFLQKHFSTRTHSKPTLLSTSQRQSIKEKYADENRKLFATYMPNLSCEELDYT